MTEAPKCDSWYEDDESFGIGHECKLPKGHEGDHICLFQNPEDDWCRWVNWEERERNG